MRLLVLGGTRFLGRALVESALERGHELTLLHPARAEGVGLTPERERELLADA